MGHGLHAAQRAAFVRTAFASTAPFSDDPRKLLGWVNTAVVERAGPSFEFVTAACVTYLPNTQVLRWAYAGHPPALWLHSGRQLAVPKAGLAPGTSRRAGLRRGIASIRGSRRHEAAARLAREFRRTMCALSRAHGSWQVKSMGHGVMIWAPEAARAVALAVDAVEQVGTRSDLLPVRVGVHTGPAVMRDCDWYGSAVNVAARLAAQAGPNEALISAATRNATRGELACGLAGRRELALRGVEQPIAVWRLR